LESSRAGPTVIPPEGAPCATTIGALRPAATDNPVNEQPLRALERARDRLTRPGPFSGLQGRFHAHITCAPPADGLDALAAFCRARRVKLTVIDLADWRSRQQRDVMTTSYHRARGPGALGRVLDQLTGLGRALLAEGFSPTRFKLEHESLPTLPTFSPSAYREVHVKLRVPDADHPRAMAWLASHGPAWGYVPSRNPRERRGGFVHQFVNLRLRDGGLAEAEERARALVEHLRGGGLEVIEVKAETAVLDTAQALDAWWA